MYELIVCGGPSDGHILGEFYSLKDARDMQDAFNDHYFPQGYAKVYLHGEEVRRY